MVKTRRQSSLASINNGESDNNPKLEKLVHGIHSATKNKNKVTKKNAPKTKMIQAQDTTVKLENENNIKLNSKSPITIKRKSGFTNEEIATFIRYVIDDKMIVAKAARKANISSSAAYRYYQLYKEDPEHKIPLARTGCHKQLSRVTQEKVEEAINYIVHDKLTITQSAEKAKISRKTAVKYYTKYLEDPEHKIPKLEVAFLHLSKGYTQDQVNNLINYIVIDNMSLVAAAKKANVGKDTARRYYLKYLNDPKHRIPVAETPYHSHGSKCTNKQVKTLVDSVVKDGMTLLEASIRANMGVGAASKYYQQYLEDPDHKTPTPENGKPIRRHTVDQVKSFFHYIIVDNLNTVQASRKANISENSGCGYYKKYLKKPARKSEDIDNSYSLEKMKKYIDYIQKDKLDSKSAAIKAKLARSTAQKYYRLYLKDPRRQIPKIHKQQYTDEDMKRLASYIEKDKMSIIAAGSKIGMRPQSAYKYYGLYRKDPHLKIQPPTVKFQVMHDRVFDEYSQIVADIYKNNPSIKPIYENYQSDSDLPDIQIKQEPVETKDELKFLL